MRLGLHGQVCGSAAAEGDRDTFVAVKRINRREAVVAVACLEFVQAVQEQCYRVSTNPFLNHRCWNPVDSVDFVSNPQSYSCLSARFRVPRCKVQNYRNWSRRGLLSTSRQLFSKSEQ